MEIEALNFDFTVCKVRDYRKVCLEDEFCFIGKTDRENSLVCRTESVPDNVLEREDGWRAFRMQGILDFSLVGILAEIAGLLAQQGISIFAVSTFDTDYVFTKRENFSKALEVLSRAGYSEISCK
ncbi:MAG: ACT domain-containing protein [Hungatella sp.]|nr:ACT domain-containing protein [Hungatella sp.]